MLPLGLWWILLCALLIDFLVSPLRSANLSIMEQTQKGINLSSGAKKNGVVLLTRARLSCAVLCCAVLCCAVLAGHHSAKLQMWGKCVWTSAHMCVSRLIKEGTTLCILIHLCSVCVCVFVCFSGLIIDGVWMLSMSRALSVSSLENKPVLFWPGRILVIGFRQREQLSNLCLNPPPPPPPPLSPPPPPPPLHSSHPPPSRLVLIGEGDWNKTTNNGILIFPYEGSRHSELVNYSRLSAGTGRGNKSPVVWSRESRAAGTMVSATDLLVCGGSQLATRRSERPCQRAPVKNALGPDFN